MIKTARHSRGKRPKGLIPDAYSLKGAPSRPTLKAEIGEFAFLRDHLGWSWRECLRTDLNKMLPPDEILIEESNRRI